MIDVATGKPFKATKVVEITEQCPGLTSGDKCFLIFLEIEGGARKVVSFYLAPGSPTKKLEDVIPEEDPDDFDLSRATAQLLGLTDAEMKAIVKEHTS